MASVQYQGNRNTEKWLDERETVIIIAVTETLTGLPLVPQQRTGKNGFVAPLPTSLATTNGIFQTPTSVPSSCNLYIGPDFVVRVPNWLGLSKMIADDTTGGITQCDFVLTESMAQLQFSVGGYRLLTLPNAGGSSELSEALSFELLQRCFRATLVKTEMEIEYFPQGGSMTDYVCALCGSDVAVSVTRAMKYRGAYTEEDAEKLLHKKLKGVVQSNHNAVTKWNKQILHIWAATSQVANTVTAVFQRMDPKVKANTVVLITTATRSPFIFENG
ncbi:hypothetical protein ACOMHN_034296 [Nucella lapillus]